MLDLEQYRVGDLPTLYYVPDAITPAEEQSLLTHITASKQQWKTVSGAGRPCRLVAAACRQCCCSKPPLSA